MRQSDRLIPFLMALSLIACGREDEVQTLEVVYVPYWPSCEANFGEWWDFWGAQSDEISYEILLPERLLPAPPQINGLIKFSYPAEKSHTYNGIAKSFQYKCGPTAAIETTFDGLTESYLRSFIGTSPGSHSNPYEGSYLLHVDGGSTNIYFNSKVGGE